jgi:hypothetical protein
MPLDPKSFETAKESSVIPFHLTNVTWGAEHTRLYLDISLPSQLSPGNIPALADRPGTVYKLYTTIEDGAAIQKSPVFQQLLKFVTTEIIYIETGHKKRPPAPPPQPIQQYEPQPDEPEKLYDFHATLEDSKLIHQSNIFARLSPRLRAEVNGIAGAPPAISAHTILSRCHIDANREGGKVGAAVVFLAPDMVFADGAFQRLAELIDAGKRAVITAGTRVAAETFVPAFMQAFSRGENSITISPRQLTGLAMKHWHPATLASYWPPRVNWPSNMFWPVGDEGIVGRCYHMHPIVVVAKRENVNFDSTIDDDYVVRAYPNDEDVYVVEDSDELCTYEISSVKHLKSIMQSTALDTPRVGCWATSHANKLHRRLVKHVVRMHGGEPSSKWADVVRRSDVDIYHVTQWMAFYDRWYPHAKAAKAHVGSVFRGAESVLRASLRLWPVRRVALAFGMLLSDDPRGLFRRTRSRCLHIGRESVSRVARLVMGTAIAWQSLRHPKKTSPTTPPQQPFRPAKPHFVASPAQTATVDAGMSMRVLVSGQETPRYRRD